MTASTPAGSPAPFPPGAVVFDAHCDTAGRLVGPARIDLGQRQPDGHLDLPRMAAGGQNAQIFAAWVDPALPAAAWAARAGELIGAIHEQARVHADALAVALSGAGVARIVRQGKVAAVIGIEGGHVLGGDPAVLGNFYRRGVRCLTLTWLNTNDFADSSDDTPRWGGLNELGRRVVGEMDRLGMMIDCAHASEAAFFDVLAVTRNPVLISHSCVRALCDIPRNVSDAVLRALRRNGGVIGLNYFPGFLDWDYYRRIAPVWEAAKAKLPELLEKYSGDQEQAWMAEIEPAFREATRDAAPVPLARVADHIEHAVGVAGIDHVGLGSDFDGITAAPAGLEDVSKLPALAAELARRGYSPAAVRKIFGGNLLRVMKKVCRAKPGG